MQSGASSCAIRGSQRTRLLHCRLKRKPRSPPTSPRLGREGTGKQRENQQDQSHAHSAASAAYSGPARRALLRPIVNPGCPPTEPSSPARKVLDADPQSHPRLLPAAPPPRISENNKQRVLLAEPRLLRLHRTKLGNCSSAATASTTLQQIVKRAAAQIYSKDRDKKVASDILDYLGVLHDQRALDFERRFVWKCGSLLAGFTDVQ